MNGKAKHFLKKVWRYCDARIDSFFQSLWILFCTAIPFIISRAFVQSITKDIQNGFVSFLINTFEYGKYLTAVVLFVFSLLQVRHYNKEKTFCTRVAYHNYPYSYFYYCARFLGYKKCALYRVPIGMQYKLIVNSTFEDYDFGSCEEASENVTVDESKGGELKDTTTDACLILIDTYEITREMIPPDYQDYYQIWIYKNNTLGARSFSKEFVKEICVTISNMQDSIKTIHLFATTNPRHNYEIAKATFSTGGRSNIKELVVYQQSATASRMFSKNDTKKIIV